MSRHLPAIERLEEALRRYREALVVISHVRLFLERTTGGTLQIEGERLTWGWR